MAKIKKKGTSGQAKNFITRTQAVRKLQISLPDFRRLCIFKGIYPREPRNKKKAAKNSTQSTTFYYTKDIQYLLHEPLLAKFRDQKALAKKIGRHLGRGEVGDAARLERTQTPRMSLDHIVKERYPTFVDALRDLDDALCMLFLFANLPSTSTIPPKTISLCQRLCLEFEHYIIVSHSLRKTFLSIKGIYYQATIEGQDILWLVPYKFVQRVTGDIDFRIMGTFIEFYTTLLGFVNFRLYTSLGLIYPPKFDAASDERGAELAAFSLQGRAIDSAPLQLENGGTSNGQSNAANDAEATAKAQAAADALKTSEQAEDQIQEDHADGEDAVQGNEIDKFQVEAQGADILAQPSASTNTTATLFSDAVVFLGRETPRAPLEFILKAFGCKRVGWDSLLGDGSFTSDASDARITHQIVDRPAMPVDTGDDDDEDDEEAQEARRRQRQANARVPGRTYVQPQWVWDCANAGKLLRPDLYALGATLPPHLSPWVKAKRGAYDPTKPLADDEGLFDDDDKVNELEDEDQSDVEEDDGEEEDDEADFEVEDGGQDESEGEADIQRASRKAGARKGRDDFAGFSSEGEDDQEEDDDEDAEAAAAQRQAQRELEHEARGAKVKTKAATQSKAGAKRARERREADEELARRRMMLPRRRRKLLDRVMHSAGASEAEAERLRRKRRKLEGAAAAAEAL